MVLRLFIDFLNKHLLSHLFWLLYQAKWAFLTKFKTKSVFQKYAEVFGDETATAEEVEQKELQMLMLR